MPRYLIVHEGVVRDILDKPSALIASDIDGVFDLVLPDPSGTYRIGDLFDVQDFAVRSAPGPVMRGSKYIDLKRYST